MALYDTKFQGQLFSVDKANSFPSELVSISPGNSFTLCVTLTLFGSVEQLGFFFFAPVRGGGFTQIFRFHMSSDCGGARRLLRRDGTAELVAWEMVQVSLSSLRLLHAVLVAIVNCHMVRRVRAPPWNDVIFSQNLPIMLALWSMLSRTYYTHFSAGIISAPHQELLAIPANS